VVTETVEAPVVIVGGGPAGYTAAIYAARAGLRPVCIEGYESGGQVIRSGRIDNFPGYPDGVSGSDLADSMRRQAVSFGARMVTTDVTSVNLDGPDLVADTVDRRYIGQAMILATGAAPRRLGLPSETEFEGRGVCYCAICDGPFFAGKRVAVVGGGNSAVEEALSLSGYAKSVVLLHRRAEFRVTRVLREQLALRPNITVLTPYRLTEVIGGVSGVTSVLAEHIDSGEVQEIGVDGLFVAIGHEPRTAMFAPWLELDRHGYVVTEVGTTATKVPGVFVAGDLADPRYRQAVTASASGCCAAIDAEQWLAGSGVG
jgi:thioredoxin reductase (NADPH)